MNVFVINLARRKDRLAAMTAQLGRLGLAVQRIPALDAEHISGCWLTQFFTPSGPLGTIPKGDQCCSLSHRRAWSAFLTSGAPYATVLEDDVILDPAAALLLRNPGWIPPGADVIKLEHYGPQNQRVLVGADIAAADGRTLAPILSRHTGAAAYVLSRRAALMLMSVERWTVPVDHLLFNPNVSKMAETLAPLQLLPAIARQAPDDSSDIRHWRQADWRLRPKLVKREIVRAYYELRLLPRQIAAVLTGKARLVRVAASLRPLPEPAVPEFARTGTA